MRCGCRGLVAGGRLQEIPKSSVTWTVLDSVAQQLLPQTWHDVLLINVQTNDNKCGLGNVVHLTERSALLVTSAMCP